LKGDTAYPFLVRACIRPMANRVFPEPPLIPPMAIPPGIDFEDGFMPSVFE
jgi:hypothetical protein